MVIVVIQEVNHMQVNVVGVAKGKFKAPDDFDAANDEVCAMLTGGPL